MADIIEVKPKRGRPRKHELRAGGRRLAPLRSVESYIREHFPGRRVLKLKTIYNKISLGQLRAYGPHHDRLIDLDDIDALYRVA